MTSLDAQRLPQVLQDAIRSDDLPTIKRHMPKRKAQSDLNAALLVAIPQSALPTIKLLLEVGADFGHAGRFAALDKKEPAVLEAFIEHGWNVNDTLSKYTALQWAQFPYILRGKQCSRRTQLGDHLRAARGWTAMAARTRQTLTSGRATRAPRGQITTLPCPRQRRLVNYCSRDALRVWHDFRSRRDVLHYRYAARSGWP